MVDDVQVAERHWRRIREGTTAGGQAYAGLIDEVRACLEALASARPDADQCEWATARFAELRTQLEAVHVDEDRQVFGRRYDLSARGQVLVPVHTLVDSGPGWSREKLTLGRLHLGVAGVAYGGVITLLFDEILGEVVKHGGVGANRTRYLNVEYLAVVPLGVEIDVESRITRHEGRKYFVEGTMRHGDTVCARAESLFVELRDGQA